MEGSSGLFGCLQCRRDPSAQLLLCWAVCGHCLPSAQRCSQADVVFGEAEGGFGKSADCSVHFWLPQKGSEDVEGKCFPYCAPLFLVT